MAEEITNKIKHIKNKAPGLSQIKKPELTNLSLSLIRRLTTIFNASLACAIAIAYEEIALTLANKKTGEVVLRDVTKVFNKAWHPGLTHRLLQLNLPMPLIKTLHNFWKTEKPD